MAHPSFPLPRDLHTHPYKGIIGNLVEIIYFLNKTKIRNQGISVIIEKNKKILLSHSFGFGQHSIAEAKSRAMHKYLLYHGRRDKKIQIFCAGNCSEKEIEDCCEKILSIYFNNEDIKVMRKIFHESLENEESELYQSVGQKFFKKVVLPD